jgi:hypothetical protein
MVEATPHLIRLRCASRKLAEMESFVETEFVETLIPDYMGGSCIAWPCVVAEPMATPMNHALLRLLAQAAFAPGVSLTYA